MIRGRWTRRALLGTVGSIGAAVLAVTGCGGGSKSSPAAAERSAPTEQTRSRVQALHQLAERGWMSGGYPTSGMALARNAYGSDENAGGAPPPNTYPAPGTPIPAAPMMGSFLRNLAQAAPTRGRQQAPPIPGEDDRDGDSTEPGLPDDYPPQPEPAPTFYFDYFLGLWVAVEEASGKVVHRLYEDQERTREAGHIETTYPADWQTYPQVYRSVYQYTGGYLAGGYGSYESVTEADYSGRMTYENVYPDGWQDRGNSNWSGRGDYSWTSRTQTGTGSWVESVGTFRSDGSGGTRTTTSEGYQAVYTYNSDGSGRGRITGSDPGLPVTITWDAYGNTTIEYADGTIERLPGWGYFPGGIGGGGIDGGTTGGGGGGGGGGMGGTEPAGPETGKETDPSASR